MQQRAGDNAARGSHFNKHTVAARAGGSHQRCSFPRQPPPLIHTHTHTITTTTLTVLSPTPAPPPSPPWPASHAATAHHSPPRRSCVTWGSAASGGKAKTPPVHPPPPPRGVTGPAVCRTRKEITTHLLLLSARVSDEQRRPLADANCRGVEGGVCVWGGGREEKCKESKRERERECWEGSGGWW